MPSTLTPAAQYLRMSTDMQQYSIDNQAAAIQRYAGCRGFGIVRTYTDAGRSGLSLRQRTGLKLLLNDVVSGGANYKAVLVYDISRWGRFQDSDEAAHYEFLCKSAGIQVHYCAEHFANDGSIPSAMMKALKRTMAAEFSRELGEKVLAGKKRLAAQGFRMGAQAGYGLRRMMIGADGRPKQLLSAGEHKSLTTDRVTLVPGPRSEVEWVRWIYEAVLSGHRPAAICRDLNLRDVKWQDGKPWNLYAVRQVLTNPKYTGCNVWARSTQKLMTPPRPNPPEQWLVKYDAFKPLINQGTFERVQKILRRKTYYQPNSVLVNKVKRYWEKHGHISESIIDRARSLPSVNALRYRFGSMAKVYELIGYRPPRIVKLRRQKGVMTETVRTEVVVNIQELFGDAVALAPQSRCQRPILTFARAGEVIIVVCRYRMEPHVRRKFWFLYTRRAQRVLPTLVCLMNRRNDGIERFHLMPGIDALTQLTLSRDDPWFLRGIRLRSLAELESALVQLKTLSPVGIANRRRGCTSPVQVLAPT